MGDIEYNASATLMENGDGEKPLFMYLTLAGGYVKKEERVDGFWPPTLSLL
jgi:hypothetical protein